MLDLRLPIGYFFLINGALLVLDGFLQPNSVLYAGVAVNLDLAWGGVLAAFGACMTTLAYLAKSSTKG